MPAKRQPPVTLAEVATAMRELREEGESVTVRAVRERVSRGSLTTISRYMEAVNAGNETPELHLEQFPVRLESLCREMVGALDELVAERVSQEREQVEAIRRNVESRWNGLVVERDTAVQAHASEQRLTLDLQQRLVSETAKLNAALSELEELRPRAVKAEALNSQLNERLLESSRSIEQLQTHIDNYSEQVRVKRQQDAADHASKVDELEQRLSSSKHNELHLTEQLGNAQRDIARLEAANQAALKRAEQAEHKQGELQVLVSDLSVEQKESKARESKREKQLNEAHSAKEQMSAQVNLLQGQLIEAQARIEKIREVRVDESRSVIINLVEHSRRVFELAKASAKTAGPDFQELAIAQREIERLFKTQEGG